MAAGLLAHSAPAAGETPTRAGVKEAAADPFKLAATILAPAIIGLPGDVLGR